MASTSKQRRLRQDLIRARRFITEYPLQIEPFYVYLEEGNPTYNLRGWLKSQMGISAADCGAIIHVITHDINHATTKDLADPFDLPGWEGIVPIRIMDYQLRYTLGLIHMKDLYSNSDYVPIKDGDRTEVWSLPYYNWRALTPATMATVSRISLHEYTQRYLHGLGLPLPDEELIPS